ncbi:hypothetical protein BSZ32_08585 [Rubritalea profundi]|uniref:Glutamine amidotransferase domain-containing protein n=2 Tax=Rubritalea profundi TaxID=1658618 RepID=A0A2S7U1U0_9BACT|nr:hypothetical protein BSZ32_08585 [Rubritalea profundi]
MLVLGAGLSMAFFLYLLRQQTQDHSKLSRWSLFFLRSMLCLLVWILIAQPRAVKTIEEFLPVSANLAIDVSQSMSLIDEAGPNTSVWMSLSDPKPLDEALTLTEAARIRLNLLARQLSGSPKYFDAEIESVLEILNQVSVKLSPLKSNHSLTRLLKAPLKTLESSKSVLNDINSDDFLIDLNRSSQLVSQTARSLRRIIAVQKPATIASKQTPRINFVNNWLKGSQNMFEDLSKRYDFRFSTFSNELSRQDINKTLEVDRTGVAKTQLYQSLNNIGRRDHTKGRQFSMLVTDGFDSGDMEKNFSNDILSQPLLVFPIGDPNTFPDSRIKSVVCPSRIQEKDTFIATVLISSVNTTPETVTLVLKEGDEILASKEVLLKGDGTNLQVDLEWQASGPGTHKFEIELSPITGDELLQNNTHILDCAVLKNHYKVLVSDTFPRWETRYLQNLFNRDPSIKMSSIVFQPSHSFPGKNPKQPMTLPFDLKSWKLYDLVILGDLTPEYLTPVHQKLVANYVNEGGNLIIMAGPNGMPARFIDGPLEPLIPMTKVADSVIHGSFIVHPPVNEPINRMVLLNRGQTQQVWQSIFQVTPQHTLVPWLKAKESARTLLTATDKENGTTYDFCATQRYGSGRIAYFAAPCLYHLRFRFGDEYHAKLWGQLIRGMCVDSFGFSDTLIATRLDRQFWKLGEEIQGRLRIRNEYGEPFNSRNFNATLSKEGTIIAEMKPVPIADRPGDFFVRFSDIPPGNYQLGYSGEAIQSILEADQKFNPDQDPVTLTVGEGIKALELQTPAAPSQFWSQVNNLPLAATISPATLPLMIEALDLKPETLKRTSKRPLWNTWWFLITILLVAASEWVLRRLTGLS